MKLAWGHPGVERLSQMADGMLEPRAQARCEKHLAGCAACRAWVAAFAALSRSLRELPQLEENPLKQLQPPVFIPVAASSSAPWIIAGGLAAGIGLAGLLLFRPVSEPMRVISAGPGAASGDQTASRLESGDPLRNLASGDVDLEVLNQVLFRLKPGTTITWQEIRRPWFFGGRPHIVLNVMSGEVLARTRDSFWGSRLQVRTPSASATVKGTAFSVKVEPAQDATTLKVLAGEVFFSPYLGRIGVNVQSGEASRIGTGGPLPGTPEALTSEERKALLETYQIGVDPQIALVIGGGPERTRELLSPALLYLSAQQHSQIHLFIRNLTRRINQAILDDDLRSAQPQVRLLEMAIKDVTDPKISVPLRLYLGGCAAALSQPERARFHFQHAADNAPAHPLASVALAAIARLAEGPLNDPALARSLHEKILAKHAGSPEAVLARRALETR